MDRMMKWLFVTLALSASMFAQAPPVHSATLTITDTQPASVTGNNYYRGAAHGGPYALLPACKLLAPTVSCVDLTVVSGNTYFWVATAVDPTGESTYSNEVAKLIPGPIPPILGNPTVAGTPPVIMLPWTLTDEPGVTRQAVFRLNSPDSNWVQLAQLKPNVTSWQGLAGKVGKTSGYKVVAYFKSGNIQSAPLYVSVK